MTEAGRRKAAPKTLLNRRIKDSDLPIVIRRRRWADAFSIIFVPLLIAFAAFLGWLMIDAEVDLGWGALFLGIFAALCLAAGYIGIDNIRTVVSVDAGGITVKGLLTARHFNWDEITRFGTWRIRAIGDDFIGTVGHQAVIHVDGSHHPRRLPRNLFFAGHFIPPLMDIGGKDLVKLLTKAKRQLEGSHTTAPGAAPPGGTQPS